MSGARILVVDDDDLVRRVVQRVAREFGEVVVEGDGAGALRALGAQAFDLVISDIRMPPPDGLELAAWVQRERPGTRVLLISGFARSEDEAAIAVLDAVLLRKPFDAGALRTSIAAALAAARLADL